MYVEVSRMRSRQRVVMVRVFCVGISSTVAAGAQPQFKQQPVYETSPGVFVSEFDNPRPSTYIELNTAAGESARRINGKATFSKFGVVTARNNLAPNDFFSHDPADPLDFPLSTFPVFRANEAHTQSEYTLEPVPVETSGVYLGHGGIEFFFGKYALTGDNRDLWNEWQAVEWSSYAAIQEYRLAEDIIIVPVHVIEAYDPEAEPRLGMNGAMQLFDDRFDHFRGDYSWDGFVDGQTVTIPLPLNPTAVDPAP